MRPNDFYIDLGTANTLIYAKSRGFLLNEPSVLALRHSATRAGELFALGAPAKKMLGKNPPHLEIVRPLREGVIADFEHTARMVHAFVKRARESVFWFKPRLLISLPCQVAQFEKRAVQELGYDLGARQVHLLDEPVAAAIGAGLSVLDHRGQMVVDIGGGTTEIAVISLGGIVTSRAVRVGGHNIDQAIIDDLKERHRFLIGEQTAERLKLEVASIAQAGAPLRSLEVGGLELLGGWPRRMLVTSEMIRPAIQSVTATIVAAILASLEECPPEIAGDILTDGIILAGGGALLHGLRAHIEQATGVPVRVTPEPLLSVAKGGALALENNRLFDGLEKPA